MRRARHLLSLAALFSLALVAEAVTAETLDSDFPSPEEFEGFPEDLATEEPGDDSLLQRLTLGGYLKNETAYRVHEPRSITKIRNVASVSAEYPVSDRMAFTFSGWAYYDLAYDLFDYETIAGRFVRDEGQPLVFVDNLRQAKDSPVAEIRELYLDIFTEDLDLRVGRQYVVWGVLEGMRVTDEVNPLDFRELILPDLLDYRIPLWTLKADYFAAAASYQFLWIPEIRPHRPAPAGSEWELLQEVPGTVRPKSFTLRDSEFGIRATTTVGETEVSLSYLYTWDDFPVVFRTARIDSSVDPTFFPTYTRNNMYGATFVRPLGPTIVKGEFVYVPDKYFGLANDTDDDLDGFLDSQGELRKKHIRWGLGVDFSLWGADFSPAIAQWIILDYHEGLIQDEFDTSVALFVRKPLPRQSAVFQLLAIGLINMEELYLKPKITFDISDHFQIATGMDLFYGQKSRLGVSVGGGGVANISAFEQSAQFLGNFNDNDRLFAEFKYTF